MVDQVSPTGSLAPGIPQPQVALAKSQVEASSSRTAKSAAPAAPSLQAAPGLDSGQSPEEAARQVDAYLKHSESDLKMDTDKATGRTVFRVVSSSTGEVLLQVPSVEVLAMARKLKDLAKQQGASGVLLDKEG